MKENKHETIGGWLLIAVILLLVPKWLNDTMLVGRLLIGLGLGYTLARSSYGFAGIVSRPFNTGSGALTRAFMYLIMISSLITVFFVSLSDSVNINYDLYVHPINFGLMIGPFIFGFGMALAGGCASGVLTGLVSDFSKAAVALFFFGMGIFIGRPLRSQDWVSVSWISTGEHNGVFLPDLFTRDGFNGYIVAYAVTVALSISVIYLSYRYENKRKKEGTLRSVPSEVESQSFIQKSAELSIYERIFTRPWTLIEGSVGLSVMYVALMGMTQTGWSVSGSFGVWFAKILVFFGMNPQTLTNYIGNPDYLSSSIFESPGSLQDIGIVVGAIIALLMMGRFWSKFISGLKTSWRRSFYAMIGGLLMGVGASIGQGCNAAGLFSPLVHFSLSGWLFLIFMFLGAIFANRLIKKKG